MENNKKAADCKSTTSVIDKDGVNLIEVFSDFSAGKKAAKQVSKVTQLPLRNGLEHKN